MNLKNFIKKNSSIKTRSDVNKKFEIFGRSKFRLFICKVFFYKMKSVNIDMEMQNQIYMFKIKMNLFHEITYTVYVS